MIVCWPIATRAEPEATVSAASLSPCTEMSYEPGPSTCASPVVIATWSPAPTGASEMRTLPAWTRMTSSVPVDVAAIECSSSACADDSMCACSSVAAAAEVGVCCLKYSIAAAAVATMPAPNAATMRQR